MLLKYRRRSFKYTWNFTSVLIYKIFIYEYHTPIFISRGNREYINKIFLISYLWEWERAQFRVVPIPHDNKHVHIQIKEGVPLCEVTPKSWTG